MTTWGTNWGWSILILTICINLAVLPLRITSMKSALKMQKIQPQVSAIREKYKKYKMGDPKQAEMNQELGALYKAEGVNMFGGCLPDADPVPHSDRVLQHAGEGGGPAACALAVACRTCRGRTRCIFCPSSSS